MATKEKEDIVTIVIDPKMTNGGITVNGRKYVGTVKVPQEQADDLLRIQTDYFATTQKLNDPSIQLRNQNIETTRKAFIADPGLYGNHPRFSKHNGMTNQFQLNFISEQDLNEWKQERMGLYGY